jgi:hypothetical protein
MHFQIIGRMYHVRTIAIGGAIRDIMRLQRQFGPVRWRKLKGDCRIQTADGRIRWAEVHWYEAHGIGRKKMKIKRLLERRP